MHAPAMVKRSQAEVQCQTALMDAYTEHLTVLEMTLIAAVEQKRSPEAAANRSETAEQKRGSDASANLGVESGIATGARQGDSLKRKHVDDRRP
jgi:hypothetical protein